MDKRFIKLSFVYYLVLIPISIAKHRLGVTFINT